MHKENNSCKIKKSSLGFISVVFFIISHSMCEEDGKFRGGARQRNLFLLGQLDFCAVISICTRECYPYGNIMFLCSDKAGFITGENICIDGGMTKLMIYHDDHGWTYTPEE